MARCAFGHLRDRRELRAGATRRGEPLPALPPTPMAPQLATAIAQLRQDDHVGIGPFAVPARWLQEAESYRHFVRLVANHVLALPHDGECGYVPKARADLEPMLALWPFVLAVPTTGSLSIDELILARAWPVHPLGVKAGPALADGHQCPPAEFFFHDVDHARFKVREDLLARGVVIPDAYVGGSTFDSASGEHRQILPAALPHVDASAWHGAEERSALAQRWLDAIAREPDRDLGEAARWLLFECVHEKSLPLDVAVLTRALATEAHSDKLRRKCANGFFGAVGPARAVVARLDDGRNWLRSRVEGAS